MSGFQGRDLSQPMIVKLRPLPDDFYGAASLTVCVNVRPENGISISCGPRGGADIHEAIKAEIARRGLDIGVETIKCLGLCARGPNVRLAPGNSWFHGVRLSDVPDLVDKVMSHMGAGKAESPR